MQDTNQPPHPANNDYAVKVIFDRVSELQMMQIQAGDDYEFCEQMEYAIKEFRKLLEKLKS